MSYSKQQEELLNAAAGNNLYHRSDGRKGTKDWYAEEDAKLKWSVDQAVSRGLIDPEAAEEAKVANQRTWWDKMWGFEEASGNLTGGFSQGIIDVLSLGNYASAAATKATIDDPLVQVGSLKMGFTPSAWYKSFKTRPYYSDMFESFWGGLAFDIALDPLTYLTFGVGAGTKVGVQGLTKVGTRELAKGTQKLTLSRHGMEMYHYAAREVRPIVEEAAKKASKTHEGLTGSPHRLLEDHHMYRFHDMIGKHMVDNYDRLALERSTSIGRWSKLKDSLRGVVEKPTDALATAVRPGDPNTFATRTVEDLFKETARVQQKDIGIDFAKTGKAISTLPVVGPAFKAIAPAFHKKLNTPVEFQDQMFLTKGAIAKESARVENEIYKELLSKEGLELSTDQLSEVTRIIDAGEVQTPRTFSEGTPTMMGTFAKDGANIDPKVLAGVKWAKERFEQIMARENEAGFKIERLEDYVHRFYKTSDAQNLVLGRVKDSDNSQFSLLRGFQMHRQIASLDDAAKLFGEEAIEQDISRILHKREMASVKMIEMEKFYDFVKTHYGIAPLMVYQAGNEGKFVASHLKKILQVQKPSEARWHNFDQVQGEAPYLYERLGFTPRGAENVKHNLDLLDYLRMDESTRLTSPAAAEIASRVRPNGLAQLSKTFNGSFKHKGAELELTEVLRSFYDNSFGDPFKWPTAGATTGKDASLTEVFNLVRKLDKVTRDELDTPLEYLFPNLIERLKGFAVEQPSLSKKVKKSADRVLRAGAERAFKTLLKKEAGSKGIRRKLEFQDFVPQLPEEMVIRMHSTRVNYGDITDFTPIAPVQLEKIKKLQKALGGTTRKGRNIFHAEHLLQVTEGLLGKKSISSLTGREADKLIQFLGLHAGEFSAVEGKASGSLFGGGVTKLTFRQRAKPHFEPMEEGVKESLENASISEMKMKAQAAQLASKIKQQDASIVVRKRKLAAKMESANVNVNAPFTARNAYEVAREDALIKGLERSRDALIANMKKITNPSRTPEIMKDGRAHMGMEEVVKRNGSRMDERDLSRLKNRAGVERVNSDISRLFSAAELKPARTARRKMGKAVKKIEEQLAKVKDNPAETDALNQKMLDIVNAAAANLDSKIKILSGGRYMDEAGKIHDILFRKVKDSNKLVLMGKDADKVKKALIDRMMMNTAKGGKNNVEYLVPALKKDLPETIIGRAAQTYYVPEEIGRVLRDMTTSLYDPNASKLVNGFLRGYDRIQNLFKVPLLAPWFSTAARNTIGNVSLNYLRAGLGLFDEGNFTDFTRVLNYYWSTESPNFRKFRDLVGRGGEGKIAKLGEQRIRYRGETGKGITVKELSDELAKRGVMTSFMRAEVFDTTLPKGLQSLFGAATGAGIGGAIGGPAGAGLGFVVGALLKKEAYRMKNLFRAQELGSELPTRLMLGIYTYKATGSFNETGRVVRNFLHDYSELSVFERRFVRRMIPFYNFTKLATRVMGTQVFENPGRVMLPHKVFNAQNTTGAGFNSPAMPEDVPDWFHKQMVFLGKDIDEETGTVKTHVYSGFNLPVQEVLQLADIVAPGGEPIAKIGSRTSFLATTVMEYITNYDTYRGGPIYPNIEGGIHKTQYESGNSFKKSPPWMKRLVGFRLRDDGRVTVNPKVAWALGEIPYSRFINISKKIYADETVEMEAEGAIDYEHLAEQFLGVNIYRYDPKQQKFFKNKRRIDAMSNILANIRVLKTTQVTSTSFKKQQERSARSPFKIAGQGPINFKQSTDY